MAERIMTRAAAKAQGLKRYFTGKPCCRGHIAERFVDGTCVPCRLAQNQRWAIANKEKKALSRKRWTANNKEHRKAYAKTYHAEWYGTNRDVKLAQNKQYLKEHPEIARLATRRWQAKNPEKAKAYAAKWYGDADNRRIHRHKRRALKVAAGGAHTKNDLRIILETQDHRCSYCRVDLRKAKRHLDHIQPLSCGGSNDRSNLQWLCAPCNLSKGAKDPLQFARELGRLL